MSKQFRGEATRARARDLVIAYLSQLEKPFPDAVAKGWAVAKRFHTGIASDKERAHARRKCWGYLGKETDRLAGTPENCILRAVIHYD